MQNGIPGVVQPVDLVIEARWIAPVIPSGMILEHHALLVRDGRISAILPSSEAADIAAAERMVLDRHLLLPGLINLHGHAAMSLLRGIANDKPLQNWLEEDIWPAEGRWVDAEFVRDGTRLAIGEMIRCGTTCFSDMYFFPEVVAVQADASGIRSQIAFPILDFPTNWGSGPDEYLHKGLALADEWKSSPRTQIAFGPHAAYTVSQPVLERVAMLSAEIDACIQIHLHENAAEVDAFVARHGERPLERLHRLGLLNNRMQTVHMTQLEPDDPALLSECGTHVVHCPESNMKLASGICPVSKLMDAGVNVALGTDGAASNNDLNLPGELRTAALLAKLASENAAVLNARQALELATINGARALGMESELGSLETGKRADCIAVELDDWNTLPVYDPVAQFIYSCGRESITHSWVDGRCLLAQRQLQTLDRDEVLAGVRRWGMRIANAPHGTQEQAS